MQGYEESLRARQGGKALPKPGPLPEPDVQYHVSTVLPHFCLITYFTAVVSPELFN